MTVQSEVRENVAEHRFEVWVGEELAGTTMYRGDGQTLPFTHTQIEPRFEGKGLGSVLIRGALDAVRARGGSVLPHCPFVQHFIKKHSEYVDLVPEDRRADFDITGTARL